MHGDFLTDTGLSERIGKTGMEGDALFQWQFPADDQVLYKGKNEGKNRIVLG